MRPGPWRVAVACLVLSGFSAYALWLGFITCLEFGCPSWRETVNTVAFFGVPTFLVVALIAALIGWVTRSGRPRGFDETL